MQSWNATADNPQARQALIEQKGISIWEGIYVNHRWLEFIRLRLYLLNRQPDDQVGYSILIYRLSERDLSRALDATTAR